MRERVALEPVWLMNSEGRSLESNANRRGSM
jgi:hypothetical protein